MIHTHRAPTRCPVCSDSLITLRLGCPTCGTELAGHFESCRYCRLDAADLSILEVFLRGRGNVRDVQAHLAVSYPTARARLTEVLERLGLGEEVPAGAAPVPVPAAASPAAAPTSPAPHAAPDQQESAVGRIMADLAAGRITVDQAELLISQGAPTG